MFNPFKCRHKNLEEKDPYDMTKTRSSTNWNFEYFCASCINVVSHSEFMSNYCNSCGHYSKACFESRSYRKIYYCNHWKIQRSYKNKIVFAGCPKEIEIVNNIKEQSAKRGLIL